ncbi:MAG: transglutaminase domain-containing protein [Ferruginibacter sp.]
MSLLKKRGKLYAALLITNLFIFAAVSLHAQLSTSPDEGLAINYSKRFKDDDVMLRSSYQLFTFDKGKNALGDKVVEVEENAEYEYMALKKYSSMAHPEFYNKFIELKNFKRSVYYGNKYFTLEKGGYDRSVTGDDIFFDDSRVQFFGLRFSDVGSAQKVTVRKIYSDGKYLTRLFFNASYPTKQRTIEFKVPDWLTVEFKKMNFDGFKVEVKENKKGGFTSYVFTAYDLPAYKNEYRRIGRAETDPHIVVQIKSFDNKGEVLKGFDKVDDVYAWNNRLYQMAGNENDKLKATVTKITEGKTKDLDKIRAIYYWVQDNIRYIAYEDGYSGYIPAPVQDVLNKKYGDCKGMANLLTEMLKLAGYNAHFSWIGTRSLPYPQSLPALCVNNHAISTLYFENKTYFLDGTEKYVPFGQNAFRIQGKEVMVAEGDKFNIIPVPVTTAEDNKLYTKADFVLENETLKGKVKVVLSGNQRTGFHQQYQELPTTSQEEFLNDFLEFGNDNLVATNVKTSDLKNRETAVNIEGDIDLTNSVNTITGDKYVGIDFFPKTLDRFVPDEKRVEGYDLDDVIKFEDEISLTVPADKKFTDKPDNLEIKNDGYEFKGEYTVLNNKLVLKKTLAIKNSLIRKKDFENWKKFLESIKEFNKYLITITKK